MIRLETHPRSAYGIQIQYQGARGDGRLDALGAPVPDRRRMASSPWRNNGRSSVAPSAKAPFEVGPFINHALLDWYVIDDPAFGERAKGGNIDFVHRAPAPIARATRQVEGDEGLVWGLPLKRKLANHFSRTAYLKIDAFCNWLPNDESRGPSGAVICRGSSAGASRESPPAPRGGLHCAGW